MEALGKILQLSVGSSGRLSSGRPPRTRNLFKSREHAESEDLNPSGHPDRLRSTLHSGWLNLNDGGGQRDNV